MKSFFAVLAIFIFVGCSSRTVVETSSSRGVAQASSVYLRTSEFPSQVQAQLIAGAEGKIKPTFEQTQALLAAYAESAEYAKIKTEYVERLYKILKINPEKSGKWIKANAEFYKGIQNYVGDSGEGENDVGTSWQTLNIDLRAGKSLNEADQKFLNEILASLSRVPTFEGLAFRGNSMTAERWKSLEVGKVWHQAAFTSTSIDPNVAIAFGSGQPPRSRRGVLILKLKAGVPVSPLTFDHGKMGQPGRFSEYEVLLEPGRNLMIRHKVESKDTCYIYAEEV